MQIYSSLVLVTLSLLFAGCGGETERSAQGEGFASTGEVPTVVGTESNPEVTSIEKPSGEFVSGVEAAREAEAGGTSELSSLVVECIENADDCEDACDCLPDDEYSDCYNTNCEVATPSGGPDFDDSGDETAEFENDETF